MKKKINIIYLLLLFLFFKKNSLVIENKLNNTNDKEQLEALKQGFYEIIPHSINSLIGEIDFKVN